MSGCCAHPADLHSTVTGCLECLCATRRAASPYPAGRQGHAPGSATSAARAAHEQTSGKAATRQATVLAWAEAAGVHGITWRDVRDATGWHHGEATSALSHLHGAGKLARLDGKGAQRHGCSPYVLPDQTAGRPVAPHGRSGVRLSEREAQALAWLLHSHQTDPWALTENQSAEQAKVTATAVQLLDAALSRQP